MSEQLFGEDWGVDESPIDDTDITTTILYFSTEQLKKFKRLAKKGIKEMFGEEFQQKGNLPIFLLNLITEKYGDIETEETSESTTSGEDSEDVPW